MQRSGKRGIDAHAALLFRHPRWRELRSRRGRPRVPDHQRSARRREPDLGPDDEGGDAGRPAPRHGGGGPGRRQAAPAQGADHLRRRGVGEGRACGALTPLRIVSELRRNRRMVGHRRQTALGAGG